jgi:hypothetical protein
MNQTQCLTLLPHDLIFRVIGYDKHFMNSVFEAAIFQTLSASDMRKFNTYGARRGIFLFIFCINTYDKTTWELSLS